MPTNLVDKLRSEGWKHQFTASGTRLAESLQNYRMLGFEVKTVPIRELGFEGCKICFEDETDASVMIFTRPAAKPPDDDLADLL